MKWFPLALLAFALAGLGVQAQATTNAAHRTDVPYAKDGTQVDAYLPASLHMKNTGGSDGPRGPGSGSGLCVFTSLEMVARALNIPQLFGFQQWMTRRPGGGWPEKVNDMISAYCKEQGVSKPDYFHVEANDLDILRKALRSGRPVGITYSYSPTGNYGGKRIAHMVMLAAAGAGNGPDGKGWYAVVDNNFPGQWEWMSESQFLSVASGGGRIWACIFAAPTYPPAPRN